MRAFVESIRSASEIREQSEAKKLKAALKHQEKRYAELDILLKKVYEDNALGRLPDKRYEMLSAGYEKEQAELEQSIKTCREQLTQYDEDTDRTEEFLALVHKYTDITELTPVIINEFVDKILVHKAEKIDGERVMEIEIYLNFIGKVELPAQELREEELAEIKEKQRLRERNAMYQRRRRAKFMPKTKAIRAKVQEAEIKEALENASAIFRLDSRVFSTLSVKNRLQLLHDSLRSRLRGIIQRQVISTSTVFSTLIRVKSRKGRKWDTRSACGG